MNLVIIGVGKRVGMIGAANKAPEGPAAGRPMVIVSAAWPFENTALRLSSSAASNESLTSSHTACV